MTTNAEPDMPFDDEDDYDEQTYAPPQPAPVFNEQQGIDFLKYGIAGYSVFELMANTNLTNISLPSHLRTFEHFRGEAGVFGDPMARLLVDSAVLAHIQSARLMVKAERQTPEAAAIYLKASAKYLSEVRHQVLALRQFRSPIESKQVTVVQQQNVAHGDQQVACLTANVTTADLPAAFSDEFATVITDAYCPVAAITHEPQKSTDELIIESFMATPEVREHLSKMDAAMAQQLETQQLSCRSDNIADAILSAYGARSQAIGV